MTSLHPGSQASSDARAMAGQARPQPATGSPSLFLTCFPGPDAGKRIALGGSDLVIGASARCNLLSDDPDALPRHALLTLDGGRLHVQALEDAPIFVDGHRVTDRAALLLDQQLRSWLGAMSAGVVEETGKLMVLVATAHGTRYRWTLNGLLIGAAVGTGFSVFETMGYVMVGGLFNQGVEGMFSIITLRGWLNLLGDHALWTGIVGAALWRVRAGNPLRLDMLTSARFLRAFGLAAALHMINDSPLNLPFYGKFLAIGFVAWVVIFGFIQAGLKEVREEQSRIAAAA